MQKKVTLILLFLISLFLISISQSFATHNRAGEITYRQISEFTYEFTLITYTYTPSAANEQRDTLEIRWGDNTISPISRIEEFFMPNDITRNTYVCKHTFPGSGTYEIFMEDNNRNDGVKNIPGSVYVPFTIKTTLLINSIIGHNNTPVLLNAPVDMAIRNQIFIHNPTAYDYDGDSLSYKITTCLGEAGFPVEGYSLPKSTNQPIYVDANTGDLIWDAPANTGTYNVAMIVEEWRDGIKIGEIVRDMQIEVYISDNEPPEINPLKDLCVIAGDTIEFDVSATEPEGDSITISAKGGPLELNDNLILFETKKGKKNVTSTFKWITNNSHIRKTPYHILFRAESKARLKDKGVYFDGYLFDFENVNIKILAPAPQNLQTKATNSTINLNWEYKGNYEKLEGFKIYRKIEKSGFEPDSCQTGIPPKTGFRLIETIENADARNFLDNNDDIGLTQGMTYCYRIVAYFSDGAESIASEEICDYLIRGIPVITNVSVTKTNSRNGQIYLAWSKPTDFNTVAAPGPYQYKIFRSEGFWGENFVLIDSIADINDTIYTDILNTVDNPWSYQVALINNEPGNIFTIGIPQIASSVYLDFNFQPEKLILNFNNNVPWINDLYEVYKAMPNNPEKYNLIGTTTNTQFIDSGLVNGTKYCYYIKSIGKYSLGGIINPIINLSQQNCKIPYDTIPPAIRNLSVKSSCDSMINILNWNNLETPLYDDAVKYNIYFASQLDSELEVIKTLDAPATKFYHHRETSLAGCYAVTAMDIYGNETPIISRMCIDECADYRLPNVFTPDGNNKNELFVPYPYNSIDKIEIQIFNRWGNLVYKTNDPDINWNGKNMENGKLVSDGVYYYICDVYELRLSGLIMRNITGFIHVYAKEKTIKE